MTVGGRAVLVSRARPESERGILRGRSGGLGRARVPSASAIRRISPRPSMRNVARLVFAGCHFSRDLNVEGLFFSLFSLRVWNRRRSKGCVATRRNYVAFFYDVSIRENRTRVLR